MSARSMFSWAACGKLSTKAAAPTPSARSGASAMPSTSASDIRFSNLCEILISAQSSGAKRINGLACAEDTCEMRAQFHPHLRLRPRLDRRSNPPLFCQPDAAKHQGQPYSVICRKRLAEDQDRK